MRPSLPVRHFCSFLNQRVRCFALRCLLDVPLEGMETRLTPIFAAVASLAAEKNPGSAAIASGVRPNISMCRSKEGFKRVESAGR